MVRDRGYLNILSVANFFYGGIVLSVSVLGVLWTKISTPRIIDAFLYKIFLFRVKPGSELGLLLAPTSEVKVLVIFIILEVVLWLFVSIFSIINGFLLRRRKNYQFCFSVAILQCFCIAISKPFLGKLSLVLGVITVITLLRDPTRNPNDN